MRRVHQFFELTPWFCKGCCAGKLRSRKRTLGRTSACAIDQLAQRLRRFGMALPRLGGRNLERNRIDPLMIAFDMTGEKSDHLLCPCHRSSLLRSTHPSS